MKIFQKYKLIAVTIIFIILEFVVVLNPVTALLYYWIFAIFLFPIILLFVIHKQIKYRLNNILALLYCLIVVLIHCIIYYRGYISAHQYFYFDSDLKLFILLEGLLSVGFMFTIELLYRQILSRYLLYSLFSTIFASLLDIILFPIIFDPILTPKYPSIFNFLFWQLNLSIVINLYINKIKNPN